MHNIEKKADKGVIDKWIEYWHSEPDSHSRLSLNQYLENMMSIAIDVFISSYQSEGRLTGEERAIAVHLESALETSIFSLKMSVCWIIVRNGEKKRITMEAYVY
jgi:hypothetical protein